MNERERGATEFVSEAQEVIEGLARNLLEIESQQRAGDSDPDLLNAAFRAVHSLKGLAGLFGASEISNLSHILESTLDALRMGRIELGQGALDVLFEAVETFQRQLAHFGDSSAPAVSIDGLLGRIDALSHAEEGERVDGINAIDESILGVLTEYEEHRLRENLRLGRALHRVHASFDLLAIDKGIEALKDKMKAFGEVITYLPSADSTADDRIELDILLGSKASLADIAAAIAEDGITVNELVPAEGATRPAPARVRTRSTPIAQPQVMEPAAVVAPPPVDPLDVAVDPDREPSAGEPEDREVQGNDISLRSLSQTVRVDLHRLDHLMNVVGELGVVQTNLSTVLEHMRARDGLSDVTRELQTQLRAMNRKLSLLQQGILDVRMVPLGQVFDKLARVVRKLGRDYEKDIRLSIAGAETELDKLIVEELSDPLMHMIRNCIDHAIEMPAERMAQGKQASGRIDLRAFQKGNRVIIEVEDDGRGIDWRALRRSAVQKRMLTEQQAAEMGSSEALNLIFAPGFTTKEVATEISGRGVGMDVVKTNISKLSGMIDIDTQVGRGTKFSITLPVTLAIIQALVIQSAGQTFCVPLNSVLESIMVQEDEIMTVEGHEVISLRGRTLPLLHLSQLFGLEQGEMTFIDPERIYVVIVGLAQHRVGLVVDELLGQQDVVIKPLGRALRRVPGIAGATELGANRTVLLLDVATLVAEAIRRSDAGSTGAHIPGVTGGMFVDGP